MEKPESTYFCNKCGYLGPTSESARFIRLDRNELDAAIDDAIAKEKS